MNSDIRGIFLIILLVLGGCAAPLQQSVKLDQAVVSKSSGRIGVIMTALPQIDTHLPGAGCLLCLAAASVANSSLADHARKLSYDDLNQIKDEVADTLRKKGATVVVVPENLDLATLSVTSTQGTNVAKKDFTSLQKKYGVDKLLVINIASLGFVRTYASYIPTSEPKGYLNGTGYLVNLNNNSYEWYLPINVTKSAGEKWDEPPKFPSLTNAYYQALSAGRDVIIQALNN